MANFVLDCSEDTSVRISKHAPITPTPQGEDWGRPASWLPLPELLDTDEKFVGLVPVTNTTFNSISLKAAGDYIVDWGDGNIENFSSGVTATHSYTYAQIPSNTITPFGYRQVLISVYPQAGQTFSSFDFSVNATGLQFFLDFVVVGPNLTLTRTSIIDYILQHAKVLCKITRNTFSSARALVNLELAYSSTSNITDFSGMFSGNSVLQNISEFDTSSGTNFQSMFSGCNALQQITNIDVTNSTNINTMFSNCRSLTSVNMLFSQNPMTCSSTFSECAKLSILPLIPKITGSATNIISGCVSAQTIPAFDLSLCTGFSFITGNNVARNMRRFMPFGMKASFSLTNTNLGVTELVEVFNNLGVANAGATLNIVGCLGTASLTNEQKLIATNKGWTLTLV
jgi:hypothetical protein